MTRRLTARAVSADQRSDACIVGIRLWSERPDPAARSTATRCRVSARGDRLVDAAQPGPGEGAELTGNLIGVELAATLDQAAAGAFGQTDDGVGERELVLRVDPGVDQRGDRRRRLGGDLAHGGREFLVLP